MSCPLKTRSGMLVCLFICFYGFYDALTKRGSYSAKERNSKNGNYMENTSGMSVRWYECYLSVLFTRLLSHIALVRFPI